MLSTLSRGDSLLVINQTSTTHTCKELKRKNNKCKDNEEESKSKHSEKYYLFLISLFIIV